MAALHAEHQHARLLGVDQGDGEVGEAEQLVDGVGGALEQLVEAEVGGDQPRDARDQRHPVGALALVLVAPRVRDGDRGRPREQGERLDLLGAEPAAGTTDAEEADHATAPLDGHPDDAMVREVGLGRIGQVAIPLEHHRAAALEHRAGQPHTARHLGAVLTRRHAVAGGGPDEVAGGIHQPDRAVLRADELAGVTKDALQQRLQLQLAADGFDHRAHALLLPQQLPELAGALPRRGWCLNQVLRHCAPILPRGPTRRKPDLGPVTLVRGASPPPSDSRPASVGSKSGPVPDGLWAALTRYSRPTSKESTMRLRICDGAGERILPASRELVEEIFAPDSGTAPGTEITLAAGGQWLSATVLALNDRAVYLMSGGAGVGVISLGHTQWNDARQQFRDFLTKEATRAHG